MEDPEQVTDVQIDMSISRGDKPEPKESKIDLDEVENLTVLDKDGTEIRFGDLYKDQKTIVVFLRVGEAMPELKACLSTLVVGGLLTCYGNMEHIKLINLLV